MSIMYRDRLDAEFETDLDITTESGDADLVDMIEAWQNVGFNEEEN